MSDDPVQLSLKLCEVLERLGVSTTMREMHRDTSICREMIDTISMKMIGIQVSSHIYGSTCEGTQTPGMGSDLDIVLCDESVPVIEDIRDAPAEGRALLMVTSRDTPPGHVKLQIVQDGTPLTKDNHHYPRIYIGTTRAMSTEQNDCEGRVCWKHYTSPDPDFDETNGPAQTMANHPDVAPIDQVAAFRCRSFPRIAEESLEKCITCGLVSRDDVEKMKRFGVLVVGVGHESSNERDIEWRISFSHQERNLMLALNPTQHKCYVTLKLIKNLLPTYDEEKKAITSYHCKTCLLNVITNNNLEWTDGNLVDCTFTCLTELTNCVTRGCCPNFFIKQSNMFDRKQFRQVRDRLLVDLQQMLDEGPSLFYRINSDSIGDALKGMADSQIDNSCTNQMYSLLYNTCGIIWQCEADFLEHCHKCSSSQEVQQYLSDQLHYLASDDTITEYTQEQTKMAIRQIEPVIQKLFAQHLASEAFSTDDPSSRHRQLEASDGHLRCGIDMDAMSCRLLEATIKYRGEDLHSCCDLLKRIERYMLHQTVVSHCTCRLQTHDCNYNLRRKISSGDINQHNMMKSSVALCTMFLPSHSELIPKALRYEMFRSVGTPPGSRRETYDRWFDWAVVDSKIYLFFMQYLVYSDLRSEQIYSDLIKYIAKRNAIDQIRKTLSEDRNLRHTETALNLLGWIYIQEGQLAEAAMCLYQSWQIRPHHNAAKWHLAILFYRRSLQK